MTIGNKAWVVVRAGQVIGVFLWRWQARGFVAMQPASEACHFVIEPHKIGVYATYTACEMGRALR